MIKIICMANTYAYLKKIGTSDNELNEILQSGELKELKNKKQYIVVTETYEK